MKTKSLEMISRVTKIKPMTDGSEVKIDVADIGIIRKSISVNVSRRITPDEPWVLLSDRPHPDWRTMSVSDYVRYGRSEMLQAVSHGEILSLTNSIGKPLKPDG